MNMKPAARALLLSIGLAASVWAAFAWNPSEGGETSVVAAPRVRAASSRTSMAAAHSDGGGEVPSISIERSAAGEPGADPFRSTTWYVPPPPPPPQPAQPPAPPPFSWSYLGRFDEGDKTAILLGRQDDSKTLRVGDTLDGTWRMSAIGERDIEFIYLPLDMKHLLPIGGKN